MKNLTVTSQDIKVLKKNHLLQRINEDIISLPKIFTNKEIDQLYLELQQYGYMDSGTKEMHIRKIKESK